MVALTVRSQNKLLEVVDLKSCKVVAVFRNDEYLEVIKYIKLKSTEAVGTITIQYEEKKVMHTIVCRNKKLEFYEDYKLVKTTIIKPTIKENQLLIEDCIKEIKEIRDNTTFEETEDNNLTVEQKKNRDEGHEKICYLMFEIKKIRAKVLVEKNKFEFWKIAYCKDLRELFLIGTFRNEAVTIIDVGTIEKFDVVRNGVKLQDAHDFLKSLAEEPECFVIENYTCLGEEYEL
ncbi:MAG: hypothetical protein ACRC5T_01310 [Cetobacterium sp.]